MNSVKTGILFAMLIGLSGCLFEKPGANGTLREAYVNNHFAIGSDCNPNNPEKPCKAYGSIVGSQLSYGDNDDVLTDATEDYWYFTTGVLGEKKIYAIAEEIDFSQTARNQVQGYFWVETFSCKGGTDCRQAANLKLISSKFVHFGIDRVQKKVVGELTLLGTYNPPNRLSQIVVRVVDTGPCTRASCWGRMADLKYRIDIR